MPVSLETLVERQYELPELDYKTLTQIPSGLIQALQTVPDPAGNKANATILPGCWRSCSAPSCANSPATDR